MAVKLRLMRMGAKKRPFYRIVATDSRSRRDGEYLELVGTYNPISNEKNVVFTFCNSNFVIKVLYMIF